MADAPQIEADSGPVAENQTERPADTVKFWLAQLKSYEDEFKDWEKRCKQIIKRYRDERSENESRLTRFNALWANINTLGPAVYAKAPQPVVERRYLDKDQMARVASMILERALEVQIEVGYYHSSVQKAVLDYLLTGRGVVWERYEPTYGAAEREGDPEPVTYEKACTDYVGWKQFRHSPAPVWEDVWWVAKEEMMTRRELRDRFKGEDQQTGKLIADLVPMRKKGADESGKEVPLATPRACVWEIWNKRDRKVIFIAPDWPDAPLEEADDPLQLEGFWPCPRPLYATTTNDCLVPVPDYIEYQDQAQELDALTQRINALTDAIRVNGVYDASYPELKRILSEGIDNRMIGIANYAEFASKGGLDTAVDFVPIKDVVEALVRLYEARDRVKADMAEITGMSDIIRGQSQGASATATEQRIKGQFASLRLEDRKKEVARFARDTIRIAAEIIAEQFSPEILAEMTAIMPVILDEVQMAMPPAPQMGHNGGPPLEAAPGVPPPPGNGAPGGGPPQPSAGQQPTMPAPAPPDPNQIAQQIFMQACDLLKNDKMRTFRIDIETDSTIDIDKEQAKQSVVELFTAIGGFLEKALMVGQQMPALTPALGRSILFAFRRFGAGRDIEGVWEQAIDQLEKMAKNPPPKPPSPDEIKAQAEQQKQQAESQRMQQQAAIDQQKAQTDMALAQQKAQLEIEKGKAELALEQQRIQLEREKIDMERQKMAMDMQAQQQKAAIEADSAMRQEEIAMAADAREAEAGERDFELSRRVSEAKAKEAMRPKPQPKGK